MATPAVDVLTAAGIAFTATEYRADDHADGYGLAAAVALDFDPDAVAKTLVAELDDGSLVCGLVSVTASLDLKALARVAGAKRATMADVDRAERVTGYVAGGISPIGQRRQLPVFVDELLSVLDVIHISGGKRGFELSLSPADLVAITNGVIAPLAV